LVFFQKQAPVNSKPETPVLSVVIPFYNEADGIDRLIPALQGALDDIVDFSCEIVAVDDGSSDETPKRLRDWRKSNPSVRIVRLSRNFGKEAALSCGLHFAAGQVVTVLDADLQDPPELIAEMIEHWRQGADVVLAHRRFGRGDGWFRRLSAAVFYRVMGLLARDAVPADVGDFRLMDRRVVDALLHLPEKTRFMKGLMNYVGFRVATVDYQRPQRQSGRSRWSFWRLWNHALDGITSFSTAPLRGWGYLGFVMAILALGFAAWIVLRTLLFGVDVPGYASLAAMILFFSGLQLISIGILGEYLARVFVETKNRPLYVVESLEGFDDRWIEQRSRKVIGHIVLPSEARSGRRS
jgi:polyisoprenyl-phosphate glycosyltransferase